MCEILDENALNVPEQTVENTEESTKEKKERLFTQKELEEKISERLSRERKNNESLLSVKQLLKNFSDKGLLSSRSYTEMAKELIGKLSENKNSGTDIGGEKTAFTPVAAETDGHDNATENGGKKDEQENVDESFASVLSRIKEKYPEGTVEKLLSGNEFLYFAKGRSGRMDEVFDDYYNFLNCRGGAEERELPGELYSTAFSSYSGADTVRTSLTKQQMEIAKGAGMSYREYSELLESIPKRGQRIKV